MSRMLDLDKQEREWLDAISEQKQIVDECNMKIAEQNERMQEAQAKIEKYARWIQTAREMFGLSDIESEREFSAGDGEHAEEVSAFSVKGLNLPQAILKTLRTKPGTRLSTTQIMNFVLKAGFDTESKHFRNIVFTTLKRMKERGRIVEEKEENENYYRLKESDSVINVIN